MIGRDEIGILIVDPSETYQRILSAILGKLGFSRVFKVTNPLKGQAILEHDQTINIVICELMMPDPANGMGFVTQIRRKFTSAKLPILMMTSLAEREYVQRAIRSGVNGYLIKPVNQEQIEAHLWRFFDLPMRGPQKVGEFLVDEGIITREQRDLALDFQKTYSSEHVDLTVIALYLGFISAGELKEVFEAQVDGETFLKQAGGLGLSPEQVDQLRKVKETYHLRLGDILVILGMVKKKDMEAALERFRQGSKAQASNRSERKEKS